MKRQGVRTFGLVAVAILLATSCASTKSDDDAAGSDGGGSGGSSGGSAEVRGVTDDTITIGGLGEGATYTGLEAGARARFERANREGGINGRMIEFVGLSDDGQDAGRNLDAARELVNSKKVFAIAPVVSQVFLPQSSDFLEQEQVPYVGWGFMPGFCGNDFGFGYNGCLVGTEFVNSALTDPILKATGEDPADIRIAIQSGDDITGKSGLAQYTSTAEKRGAEIVYAESNLPTATKTTDYSPYVQAILKSDPTVVYASARFEDVIGLSGALRQGGFEGPIVNFVTYVPGLLDAQPEVAQALEGVWVNSQIPPSESDSPAVQQIIEDLEAIDEDPFVTLGGSVGYWSADVMVQQLEAAGPDLSPESFLEAMQDFTYEPLEGGIGPVSFPQDQTAPTPCASVVEIKDGKYDVLLPMDCYEAYPAE